MAIVVALVLSACYLLICFLLVSRPQYIVIEEREMQTFTSFERAMAFVQSRDTGVFNIFILENKAYTFVTKIEK